MTKLPELQWLLCRRSFTPTRTWQRFCGPTCRGTAHAQERQEEQSCEYCGQLAETIDHVPPRAARPTLIELGLADRYPFLEVHACHECNCLLGHRPLWTVKQRREFLHKRLAQRYAKYLKIPDWTDRELGTLGRDLQDMTLHGLAVRDFIRARIVYAK